MAIIERLLLNYPRTKPAKMARRKFSQRIVFMQESADFNSHI